MLLCTIALALTPALASPAETKVILEDPGELFARAADSYRRGELEEAESVWKRVLRLPLAAADRARVCYDLGNVAWRDDRRGEAIGWYTAALRHDPRHSDAWANLEFARSEEGFDPADRGDLRSTVRLLVTRWYPGERRLFVLVGVALVGLAMIGETWRGGRFWLAGMFAALGLLVVLSVPWLAGLVRSDGDPLLVIRSSTVSLRSEPRLELPAVTTAAPGVVVERIDELPGWVRVETAAGEKGWLREDAVFSLSR